MDNFWDQLVNWIWKDLSTTYGISVALTLKLTSRPADMYFFNLWFHQANNDNKYIVFYTKKVLSDEC